MHLASASGWAQEWGPLISLFSNSVLVAVTAWYAYLTRSMSKSARASAEQSRIAAEATQASATAAEASLDVRFALEPLSVSTVDEMIQSLKGLMADGVAGDVEVTPDILSKVTTWEMVALTCLGATVTVHSLELMSTGVASPASDSKLRIVRSTSYVDGIPLKPAGTLPRLCHAGETVEFLVGDSPINKGLADFQVRVSYSVGNSPVRAVGARWTLRSKSSKPNRDGPLTLGIRGQAPGPIGQLPP